MQSHEDKLVQRVRAAESVVEEQLFDKWRQADSTQEREMLACSCKALKALTNSIIHAIRGEKNG